MKTRICAALMVMLGVGTAGAQLVSSHAPSGFTAKMAPHAISAPAANANALPPATMSPALQPTCKVVARVNGTELIDRDLVREMFTLFPYAQQHNGFPKGLEPEIRRGALLLLI